MTPLVRAIMPSTAARDKFRRAADRCIFLQTYPLIAISYDLDQGTIGAKRNRLCEAGFSEFIAHFDDDDWSAPARISEQVAYLQANPSVHVVGYHSMLFHEPMAGRLWRADYKDNYPGGYCFGTSLCYRRSWWESHPFEDRMIGEDNAFVKCAGDAGVLRTFPAGQLMVARIHHGNTSKKETKCGQYTQVPLSELPEGYPPCL